MTTGYTLGFIYNILGPSEPQLHGVDGLEVLLGEGILGEEDIKECREGNMRVLWRMLQGLLGQKIFLKILFKNLSSWNDV